MVQQEGQRILQPWFGNRKTSVINTSVQIDSNSKLILNDWKYQYWDVTSYILFDIHWFFFFQNIFPGSVNKFQMKKMKIMKKMVSTSLLTLKGNTGNIPALLYDDEGGMSTGLHATAVSPSLIDDPIPFPKTWCCNPMSHSKVQSLQPLPTYTRNFSITSIGPNSFTFLMRNAKIVSGINRICLVTAWQNKESGLFVYLFINCLQI